MSDMRDFATDLKCPFCPVCGTPPESISPQMQQVFCANEECNVLMWVPWETAAKNLMDSGYISINGEVPPKHD